MTAVDTYLLLRAFCDELARCGLQHACTSPGSRNTPIVLSLAREPRIRTWSHIDERCAGFFALGAAKASGRPVAMTCTSGSAAANYAPAVTEAAYARVPLIVLTADRPPQLRDVGAGQAIDQLKLYGDAVRWFVEVGVERATPEALRWMRQLACRAYWTALGDRPGPVHLNFPLHEPLVLDAPLPADPVPGRAGGRPWVMAARAPVPAAPPPPAPAPDRAPTPPVRGVVVAGRHERGDGLGALVARFAARAGFVLFADPLSGARHGPAAIAAYDLLLRDPGLTGRLRPELVVRVGYLPTSKPLRAWLASLDGVPQVSLDAEAAWQDPAGVVTETIVADPAATLAAWLSNAAPAPGRNAEPAPGRNTEPAPGRNTEPGPDPGANGGAGDGPQSEHDWAAAWRTADAAVQAAIDAELGDDVLSEPLVARLLAAALSPDDTLLVAASMPIRDVETYFPADGAGPRVLSNRGTNGIDGTVSTAFGIRAAGSGAGRVVLLIGDVALAHDLGGLLAARRLGLAITIVLLNNDGGGIFHFLPVSGETDHFEEHVATPHGLSWQRAAALYDIAYTRATTAAELRDALAAAQDGPGTRMIEVPTERAGNLALHRRLAAAALDALPAPDGAGPPPFSPTASAASPGA